MTRPLLVTGATGKVGRRVVRRLRALDLPHRGVTRRSDPRFDFADDSTWSAAVDEIGAAFIVPPDEAPPAEEFARFAAAAVAAGAEHLIVLSARTFVDDGPSAIERAVDSAGVGTTFLRPTWFFDNFVEYPQFTDELKHGRLVLPTGDGREALIAADDIAAVAVEAFRSGPFGPLDLSGPRGEVFADVPVRLAAALGRDLVVDHVDSAGFRRHLAEFHGYDTEVVQVIGDLMERIAAGREAYVSTTVAEVLGRPPRSMIDWIAALPDDAWPR